MSRTKVSLFFFSKISLVLALSLAGILNSTLPSMAFAQVQNDPPNPVTTGATAADAIPWTIRPGIAPT